MKYVGMVLIVLWRLLAFCQSLQEIAFPLAIALH